MTQTATKPNRGPAAAAENRAALLAAARCLFAERGYHVPLSAIAREAGVGQGSLYRHFPQRELIAAAILEENLAVLERSGGDFAGIWRTVVEQLVQSGGFVETTLGSVDAPRTVDMERRFCRVVAEPLAQAQQAGTVAADLRVADLVLVMRMLLGAIGVEKDVPSRRAAAAQVLALVGRGLELDEGE